MITLAYDNAWSSIFRNSPPLHFLCNFLAVPFLCVENFDFLCKDISLFFHPHNAGGFPSLPRIMLADVQTSRLARTWKQN